MLKQTLGWVYQLLNSMMDLKVSEITIIWERLPVRFLLPRFSFEHKTPQHTAFPCALSIAASFDEDAARTWGTAMGLEFYQKGANVSSLALG